MTYIPEPNWYYTRKHELDFMQKSEMSYVSPDGKKQLNVKVNSDGTVHMEPGALTALLEQLGFQEKKPEPKQTIYSGGIITDTEYKGFLKVTDTMLEQHDGQFPGYMKVILK